MLSSFSPLWYLLIFREKLNRILRSFPYSVSHFALWTIPSFLGLSPFLLAFQFHHLSSSLHCNVRQYSCAALSTATTWTHPAICSLPKAKPPTLQQQKQANICPHQRNTKWERNKSQANSLSDFWCCCSLLFNFSAGILAFCIPGWKPTRHIGSFSFLLESQPLCLIVVLETLAGTILEMYIAMCLSSFQSVFHNPDNNLLFTIRCSSNFLNAQAIIFFGNWVPHRNPLFWSPAQKTKHINLKSCMNAWPG